MLEKTKKSRCRVFLKVLTTSTNRYESSNFASFARCYENRLYLKSFIFSKIDPWDLELLFFVLTIFLERSTYSNKRNFRWKIDETSPSLIERNEYYYYLLLRLLSCECICTLAELGIERRLLVVELDGLGGSGGSSSMDVLSGVGGLLIPELWWLWCKWCNCSRAWSGWSRLARRDCWGVVAGLVLATPHGDGDAFSDNRTNKVVTVWLFLWNLF